ncbi:MAG: TetR/AcrR family transcriptional regulator [Thermoleophilaceae bacterium]
MDVERPQTAGAARRLPPGRHGLSRDHVVKSQRERVQDAVVELVAEKGYLETTVQEITKRAGVSKATFYENFADKEDCFWSANDTRFLALALAVNNGYDEGGDAWPGRLRGGIKALLEFLAAEHAFARVVFIEALAVGESGLARRHLVLTALRSYFDPELRPEMNVGVERPNLVAEAVVDSLAGMLFTRILEHRAQELPDDLDDFVYVALLPYGGHRALS